MDVKHIIGAWRDEEYRASLDAETQALVPESPIGEITLSDAELAGIEGATQADCSVAVSVSLVVLASELLCLSLLHGGSCPLETNGCNCPNNRQV